MGRSKLQVESNAAFAVNAGRHIVTEAMPAVRRALNEVRKIPGSELWVLDLQNVIAQLDVAATALVGKDAKQMLLSTVEKTEKGGRS